MASPAITPGHRVSVFISYSTTDSAAAAQCRKHIEGKDVQCFIAEANIRSQKEWKPVIQEEIRNCQLFLLLFSSFARDSLAVREEIGLALSENKEIWVVEVEPTKINGFFERESFMERQFFRGSSAFAEVLDHINERWPIPPEVPDSGVLPNNCPYPGPAPFSEKFAELFFGRLESTQALKAAVNGDKRMLLVWGPSGAGKTSLLTVGLGKVLAPQYFYSRPVDGNSAETLLKGLYKRLLEGIPASREAGETYSSKILEAINARPESDFLFCFDQMENFFTWPPPTKTEIEMFLDCLQTVLRQSPRRVTVMISFRKESLADVQPHIKRLFEGNWEEFIVRKLTSADALICITEPARIRGVQFDENLARAIIAPIEEDQGGNACVVDPMNIQKVCQELWKDVAQRKNQEAGWRLDGGVLPEILAKQEIPGKQETAAKDEGLEKNATKYVTSVLQGFMRMRIEDIANSLPPDTAGPQPKEYVLLSLLEFVGPNNVRQRVRETIAQIPTNEGIKDEPRVGRLSLDVVKKLVDSGLVQRCGSGREKEYELAHDTLADEIGKHAEASDSVAAMKNLDAVMIRQNLSSQLDSGFNGDSELLSRLEKVRENKWQFQEQEAELIFRRALGDHRNNIRGAKISVDAWAHVLAEKSPKRLIDVLVAGLSDGQDSVQLDVLNLLLKPAIRELVATVEEEALGTRLSEIVLDSKTFSEVREKATQTLVSLGYKDTIAQLFRSKNDGSTTALALVRHAEDRSEAVTPAFKASWKALRWHRRLHILWELWFWRCKQSYQPVLYIIALATVTTAIGAVVPFIPLGQFGASLTLDADYSAAAGIFQGASGGTIWGLGVTTGLLIYCIILRGGRIRKRGAESLGMAFSAMMGGTLGGIVNTLVITLVFVGAGLVTGGWLNHDQRTGRLPVVFNETHYGWATPIFGAALGIGIGLSLKSILADPPAWWNDDPLAKDRINKTFRRICLLVLKRSWVTAFWIGLGAVAAAIIINHGAGTCDALYKDLSEDLSKPCPHILPAIWVRSAGLGVVILGGSLGEEIGFLFGLLSVQFGVNLKKNPEFLGSSQ